MKGVSLYLHYPHATISLHIIVNLLRILLFSSNFLKQLHDNRRPSLASCPFIGSFIYSDFVGSIPSSLATHDNHSNQPTKLQFTIRIPVNYRFEPQVEKTTEDLRQNPFTKGDTASKVQDRKNGI